jgi:hypothetical protein
MKCEDLRPFLDAEVEKWSARPYEVLRQELEAKVHAECQVGAPYHLEVGLLEDRPAYLHVMVAVCGEDAKVSCFHPLSASFIVYRAGRVDK